MTKNGEKDKKVKIHRQNNQATLLQLGSQKCQEMKIKRNQKKKQHNSIDTLLSIRIGYYLSLYKGKKARMKYCKLDIKTWHKEERPTMIGHLTKKQRIGRNY